MSFSEILEKLYKLAAVFERIVSDSKIKEFIAKEELDKIMNILTFLRQVKEKHCQDNGRVTTINNIISYLLFSLRILNKLK